MSQSKPSFSGRRHVLRVRDARELYFGGISCAYSLPLILSRTANSFIDSETEAPFFFFCFLSLVCLAFFNSASSVCLVALHLLLVWYLRSQRRSSSSLIGFSQNLSISHAHDISILLNSALFLLWWLRHLSPSLTGPHRRPAPSMYPTLSNLFRSSPF